ncbi:MAG: cupredoxin domain-containing protein [Acidimicrobiales bacterium]
MTRTKSRLAVAALAVGALTLAACGDDDDTTAGTASSTRTVEIDMRDIEFSPDQVDVQEGETVRFVFHNKGAVNHDAFIGDEAAQDGHEMEMREMGGMGDDDGGHDPMGDEGGITVMPGETGEITHTFAKGDDLLIGCHEEGHYGAGMRMMINVS